VLPHAAAGQVNVLGMPTKLSDTPGSIRTAPPMLGEHTAQVLRDDLGLSGDQIRELAARGVIRT
jgi:crotonobetainyl-CoA:carnitine CoA-transferase CaiB-like acyl-CoA transferase